jgi:superfamily I DNA/RNA helicase
MIEELYADKSIEGLSRYENIQELLNGIKEYVDDPEREDKSLGAFLQDIALVTDSDLKDAAQEGEAVTMMTIHSAKGLEFRNVYIVGMEENLFPSQMMMTWRKSGGYFTWPSRGPKRNLRSAMLPRATSGATCARARSRGFWMRLTLNTLM